MLVVVVVVVVPAESAETDAAATTSEWMVVSRPATTLTLCHFQLFWSMASGAQKLFLFFTAVDLKLEPFQMTKVPFTSDQAKQKTDRRCTCLEPFDEFAFVYIFIPSDG